MQKDADTRDVTPAGRHGTRPWLISGAAVVFVLLDRLCKLVALSSQENQPYGMFATMNRFLTRFGMHLTAPGDGGPTGVFAFQLFPNKGAIFSLPLPMALVIVVSSIIIAAVIAGFVRALGRRDHGRAAIFLLIILGAASNLYDRVAYGATIDYLIFFGRSAWNLADGMIIAGILLLLFNRERA